MINQVRVMSKKKWMKKRVVDLRRLMRIKFHQRMEILLTTLQTKIDTLDSRC